MRPCLVVEALGDINYIHAGYHTARYMFPVGYRAVRRVAGGMPALAEALADAAQEAPALLCQVLEGDDGPLFRVTPVADLSAFGHTGDVEMDGVRPARYWPPRHPTQFEPSCRPIYAAS